jgi:protein tyrosine phosphatase (PTP) superfamily phosphohydrolase (DUF442 family)
VVPPNFPARTAKEVVALARSRPGHFTFSSSGTGATAHVVAAWFHALARHLFRTRSPACARRAVPPLAGLPGVAGYDAGAWIGVMAPAGTPAPILDRLDAEITRAMGDRAVRERLANAGLEPIHHNRAGMRGCIEHQRRCLQTAIRAAVTRIEGEWCMSGGRTLARWATALAAALLALPLAAPARGRPARRPSPALRCAAGTRCDSATCWTACPKRCGPGASM